MKNRREDSDQGSSKRNRLSFQLGDGQVPSFLEYGYLRPYQVDILQQFYAKLSQAGDRKGALVVPSGAGKLVMMATLVDFLISNSYSVVLVSPTQVSSSSLKGSLIQCARDFKLSIIKELTQSEKGPLDMMGMSFFEEKGYISKRKKRGEDFFREKPSETEVVIFYDTHLISKSNIRYVKRVIKNCFVGNRFHVAITADSNKCVVGLPILREMSIEEAIAKEVFSPLQFINIDFLENAEVLEKMKALGIRQNDVSCSEAKGLISFFNTDLDYDKTALEILRQLFYQGSSDKMIFIARDEAHEALLADLCSALDMKSRYTWCKNGVLEFELKYFCRSDKRIFISSKPFSPKLRIPGVKIVADFRFHLHDWSVLVNSVKNFLMPYSNKSLKYICVKTLPMQKTPFEKKVFGDRIRTAFGYVQDYVFQEIAFLHWFKNPVIIQAADKRDIELPPVVERNDAQLPDMPPMISGSDVMIGGGDVLLPDMPPMIEDDDERFGGYHP